MKTTNGKLAVEVPETRQAKVSIEGGIAKIGHHRELLPLKVLFDSDKYKAGQIVYFHGEVAAKIHIYNLGDLKYALTEESLVMAYEEA